MAPGLAVPVPSVHPAAGLASRWSDTGVAGLPTVNLDAPQQHVTARSTGQACPAGSKQAGEPSTLSSSGLCPSNSEWVLDAHTSPSKEGKGSTLNDGNRGPSHSHSKHPHRGQPAAGLVLVGSFIPDPPAPEHKGVLRDAHSPGWRVQDKAA